MSAPRAHALRPTALVSATPLEALTPPPGWGDRVLGVARAAPGERAGPKHASTRLLDQLRAAVRTLHYSPRTEHAYVYWVKRYVFHHSLRHPAEIGADEIRSFLSHLAVAERVSAST